MRELYAELLALAAPSQPLTAEVDALAERYAARGIVGPMFCNDLPHVAPATVADADVVVSWKAAEVRAEDAARPASAPAARRGVAAIE